MYQKKGKLCYKTKKWLGNNDFKAMLDVNFFPIELKVKFEV